MIWLGVVGCIAFGFLLDNRSRTPDLPPPPQKPKPDRWWLVPIEDLPRYLRERRKPPNI